MSLDTFQWLNDYDNLKIFEKLRLTFVNHQENF